MPWKGEKDPYRIWLSEIILAANKGEPGTGILQPIHGRIPNY